MKTSHALAAASLALLSSIATAQMPPGVTMEMVNTVLPEEGAPKAVTGKYAVVVHVAPGNDALKVLHPTDLAAFPAKDTLPVLVWGNGGCAIDNPRYEGFLQTIASHGFIVISTRSPAAPAAAAAAPAAGRRLRHARAQANGGGPRVRHRLGLPENAREGSPLKGKIDTKHVAVMGQSCGGRLSMELGRRLARIDHRRVQRRAAARPDADAHAAAHPALFINGGERDFMMGPSKATFDAIDKLPVFYGSRHGAGHTATAYHAGGGEFANVATNWVRWQFKGDKQAAKMFIGRQLRAVHQQQLADRREGAEMRKRSSALLLSVACVGAAHRPPSPARTPLVRPRMPAQQGHAAAVCAA